MNTASLYLTAEKQDTYNNVELLPTKEFSHLVNIPVARLRYYDRIGILIPASRVLFPDSKKIGYSPMQITTVGFVRTLIDIGVKVEVIQELVCSRSPDRILKLMFRHENEVARLSRFLAEARLIIKTREDLIEEGIHSTESDLTVVEKPARSIVLGDLNTYSGNTGFIAEFTRFCRYLSNRHFSWDYPIGGYFESMGDFLNNPSQPQRFFTLDPHSHDCKPAGLYLTGYTRGYYGETNGIERRLDAYAKKHGLDFVGPVYNIYLFSELCIPDPRNYLLQVSVPVSESLSVVSNTTKYSPIKR